MNYKVEVYQSLNEIDISRWNLNDEPLPVSLNFDYLKMIELEHNKEIDFYYGLITENNLTVGILCFQMIEFKGAYVKNFFRDEVERGLVKNLFLKAFYKILDRLNWNLLTAGNIYFTGDHGIYFHSKVTEIERVELISKTFVKAETLASKKVTAYMVNNVYDARNPAIHQYLKSFQYATYPVDPDMFFEFNPNWKNFEDYSKSISSKYRVRMKKVLKQSQAVEMKLLSLEEIKNSNEAIYNLYMNTADKVDLNLGFLSQGYFLKMAELWKDNFRIIGYYFESKLIGFMSILVAHNEMDVNYMGLDYEYNFKLNLYNRMLFDLIKLGIALEASTMHLGRTATEMKSTIGATAKSMHIYLRGKNPLMNRAMNFFEPYFGSPQYTLRSPFKKV